MNLAGMRNSVPISMVQDILQTIHAMSKLLVVVLRAQWRIWSNGLAPHAKTITFPPQTIRKQQAIVKG